MKPRHLAPALLALAACSSRGSTPPAAAPDGPIPEPVVAPPIFGLLGQREALGLTGEQIGRLEAIGTSLRERNDSLEAAVREEQRAHGTPRNRGDQRRLLRDALPTLGRIWSNNRSAMDEVRDVLTSEQRERVCVLERERMPERERERQEREAAAARARNRPYPRMRGPRSMGTDSALVRLVRGWAWCAESGAAPVVGDVDG